MNTVFTPECVQKMVEKGTFRKVRLKDLPDTDCDEVYIFIFPSEDIFNQANGDGDWLEVEDYAMDSSCVFTSRGEVPAKADTTVYVR